MTLVNFRVSIKRSKMIVEYFRGPSFLNPSYFYMLIKHIGYTSTRLMSMGNISKGLEDNNLLSYSYNR